MFNNIFTMSFFQKERGIETLFGQFFKQIADHDDSSSTRSGIKYGSASKLYLRILASGITIAVLNEANTNGMIGLESDLSSQVLPILIKTASDILDQDQRKLVSYFCLAKIVIYPKLSSLVLNASLLETKY